jgi:hypothetical protein
MNLIPSWDAWLDTPQGRKIYDDWPHRLTLSPLIALEIFSAGHRYGSMTDQQLEKFNKVFKYGIE